MLRIASGLTNYAEARKHRGAMGEKGLNAACVSSRVMGCFQHKISVKFCQFANLIGII